MEDKQKDLISMFMYGGITIALIVSSVNFFMITRTLINYYLPHDDLSWHGVVGDYVFPDITAGLAFLIVAFSIFLYLSIHVKKFISPNSSTVWQTLRNAIVILIVAVSAIVIAISLALIIKNFLEGYITRNSIIDSIVVLVMGGCIFYYYRRVLKNYWKDHKDKEKTLALGVSAVMLLTIAVGIYTINPFERIDVQETHLTLREIKRVDEDLRAFYKSEGTVPETLDDADLIEYHDGRKVRYEHFGGGYCGGGGYRCRGFNDYEYNRVNNREYTLCADFKALPTGINFSDYPYADYPVTKIGNTCFTTTF